MKISEILIRAYKKIEKPECWMQDASHSFDGTTHYYCLTGAVQYSCYSLPASVQEVAKDQAYIPIKRALMKRGFADDTGSDIVEFNDADERTHTQVLLVLQDAIVYQLQIEEEAHEVVEEWKAKNKLTKKKQ